MIVIATLLADRKRSSQMVGIPEAAKMNAEGIDGGLRYYINIETEFAPTSERFEEIYAPLLRYLRTECPIPWDLDTFTWRSRYHSEPGPWRTPPAYDQDQRRLSGICVARNAAREYALATGATHLQFVDADVIVPADTLQRLLALDHDLVGGLVPGRGAHSHVWYVFGEYDHIHKRRLQPKVVKDRPGVVEVEHGTCGCLLIKRKLFSTLAFRSGLSRQDWKTALSEDPAYASDALLNGFGGWWIDTNVRCQHKDDPTHPLTDDQVSDDYSIPK